MDTNISRDDLNEISAEVREGKAAGHIDKGDGRVVSWLIEIRVNQSNIEQEN